MAERPSDRDGAAISDPAPLRLKPQLWIKLIGPAISLAILVAVLYQLQGMDFGFIRSLVPTSAAFWLVFAAYYLAVPLCEWQIFRKLWRIPLEGFFVLVRKHVGNSIVLGYIGELDFYNWARKRTDIVGSPFGAVKDVAILSAMVGNGVTLVLLVGAWPLFEVLNFGSHGEFILGSVAVVLLSSLAMLAFRHRLFSLPRDQIWYVVRLHLVRVAASTILSGFMWHLVLPSVDLGWWLVLSTLSLLISRLPLIPNKDIVFAGVAVFLVGQDAAISSLVALTTGLTLTTHLLAGLLLVAAEFWGVGREKWR